MLRASAAHFPGVGWLVGAVGGAACSCSRRPGCRAWRARWRRRCCRTVATVLLTGAFHEDGLADVADGLGGSAERERALEIMKDSRIGAFGAIALVLALGLKVALLAALAGQGAMAVASALLGGPCAVAAGAAVPDPLAALCGRRGREQGQAAGRCDRRRRLAGRRRVVCAAGGCAAAAGACRRCTAGREPVLACALAALCMARAAAAPPAGLHRRRPGRDAAGLRARDLPGARAGRHEARLCCAMRRPPAAAGPVLRPHRRGGAARGDARDGRTHRAAAAAGVEIVMLAAAALRRPGAGDRRACGPTSRCAARRRASPRWISAPGKAAPGPTSTRAEFDAWTRDFADARAGGSGESTRAFMQRVGEAYDDWRAGRPRRAVGHACRRDPRGAGCCTRACAASSAPTSGRRSRSPSANA